MNILLISTPALIVAILCDAPTIFRSAIPNLLAIAYQFAVETPLHFRLYVRDSRELSLWHTQFFLLKMVTH